MKTMTARQVQRQTIRRNGRYAKINPCLRCGGSICGAEYMHIQDDPRTVEIARAAGMPDIGMVCHKCWLQLGV